MFSMKLDLNLWSGIRSEPSANWATSTDPSPRPPPSSMIFIYSRKKGNSFPTSTRVFKVVYIKLINAPFLSNLLRAFW